MRPLSNGLMSRISRWLPVVLLVIASTLLLASPAQAHARRPLTGSDTVTLSTANGSSFSYGSSGPSFTAVITFTTPAPTNGETPLVTLDTGATLGPNFGGFYSSDRLTLTFTRITAPDPIPAGQHAAVASYYDTHTNTTLTSNTVHFTITKGDIQLACSVDEAETHFMGNGQTIHVKMTTQLDDALPADMLNATYTVKFDGPTHVAFPNLTPNSNFEVLATSPTQIGSYLITCIFNGSTDHNPGSITDPHPYLFSALHSLGSAQLYTNPTKLVAGKTMQFYIVLHAAPGLPVPTGRYAIDMANYYTPSIILNANGESLVRVTIPSSIIEVTKITINYSGDKYYNRALINFPLTNPPIPSGSGGGSGGGSNGNGNSSQGTATATGTASANGTATGDSSTPTSVGVGGALTHPTASDGGIPLAVIALVSLLSLLVLAALVGIAIYLLRRRRLA